MPALLRPQGSNETGCQRAQAWIVAVAELRPGASPVNVPELEAPLWSVSDTCLLRFCPKMLVQLMGFGISRSPLGVSWTVMPVVAVTGFWKLSTRSTFPVKVPPSPMVWVPEEQVVSDTTKHRPHPGPAVIVSTCVPEVSPVEEAVMVGEPARVSP